MVKKKRVMMYLCALALATLLAGCGPKEGNTLLTLPEDVKYRETYFGNDPKISKDKCKAEFLEFKNLCIKKDGKGNYYLGCKTLKHLRVLIDCKDNDYEGLEYYYKINRKFLEKQYNAR